MLKNYLSTICLFVCISGCNIIEGPNATIDSKCTLNGNGDYKCIFTNRGKIEGSLCESLLIGLKKVDGKKPKKNIIDTSIYDDLYVKTKESIATAKSEYSSQEFDEFLKLINPILVIVTYNRKDYAVSDEFCSGLVRAGDVREINGTASFNMKFKPVDICNGISDIWTDNCYFTSISSDKMKNEIRKEFNY